MATGGGGGRWRLLLLLLLPLPLLLPLLSGLLLGLRQRRRLPRLLLHVGLTPHAARGQRGAWKDFVNGLHDRHRANSDGFALHIEAQRLAEAAIQGAKRGAIGSEEMHLAREVPRGAKDSHTGHPQHAKAVDGGLQSN